MSYIMIDLNEQEGNAFAILGLARKWAEQLKEVDPEKFNPEKISKEMKQGDYNNLLDVFDKYFEDVVGYEFINDPRA